MKNEVELLKEMMQKKRGTGRTRRMIFEAARHVFLEGQTVVIVVKTDASRAEIARQVCKYFTPSITDNINICLMGRENEFIKTLHSKPVVLHDHYCFEQDLIDLMKKYTMYDK